MELNELLRALVKGLVWEKPGTVAASYKAVTPFIVYRINDNGENWADDRFTLWGADNRYSMGRHPTLAAAKAAAEADYRARIAEALRLDLIAGLVEAAEMSRGGWENALELGLIPEGHRHSARTMADVLHRALAAFRAAGGDVR